MSLYEGRDIAFKGVIWQYMSSIVSLLAGLFFYIFIVRLFSTQIIGVFSLLSAILLLFNSAFSLGLGTGLQHFISYHLGKGEGGKIRAIIKEFALLGIAISFLAFISLWILSPIFSELFFHTYDFLDYIRLIDVELVATVFNSFIFAILLGLQKFKMQAEISIINSGVAYGLVVPFLLLNYDPIVIILAWIVGYFLTTSILLMVTYKTLKEITADSEEKVKIWPVIIYSLPVFIASLVGFGSTYVDRFIVSFLRISKNLICYHI